MFVGRARAYPSEATFRCSNFSLGSWAYPQTLDKAGKLAREKYYSLLLKSLNYGQKKFYETGLWPNVIKLSTSVIYRFL
jgi:hypothetical protein